MIKHIVLFNVKEGEDKDAVAAVAKAALEPLVGRIPGLISLEVKRCFAGCDFALVLQHMNHQIQNTGHEVEGGDPEPHDTQALEQVQHSKQHRSHDQQYTINHIPLSSTNQHPLKTLF